jgi:hypothetical protein
MPPIQKKRNAIDSRVGTTGWRHGLGHRKNTEKGTGTDLWSGVPVSGLFFRRTLLFQHPAGDCAVYRGGRKGLRRTRPLSPGGYNFRRPAVFNPGVLRKGVAQVAARVPKIAREILSVLLFRQHYAAPNPLLRSSRSTGTTGNFDTLLNQKSSFYAHTVLDTPAHLLYRKTNIYRGAGYIRLR